MAFKSLSQYQEDKNGEFFVLPNDGDYADVVFLYRSIDDVLVADVHYISSNSYKGYAHCCGTGCPACNYGERGIRLDHKIFIPLYNIQKNKIEFWDRSTFFEQVLQKHVFGPFPNPSETVFRVTRHGDAGSRDTKYEIVPVGRNTFKPYDAILSDFNVTFPDYYSTICIEMSSSDMYAALNNSGASSDLQDYGYVPVARGSAAVNASAIPDMPTVDTPQYSAPPEVAPPVVDVSLGDYNPEAIPAPVEEAVTVEEMSAAAVPDVSDDSSDSLDDVKF